MPSQAVFGVQGTAGWRSTAMSNLTFLFAESFLVITGTLLMAFVAKLAHDKSAEIITGVVRGISVSPGVREGMLFGMWLPWHAASIAVAAFLALTQLGMVNHVTDANIKVVAYFGAFIFAFVGTFALALTPVGQVPSPHRAGLDAVAGCVWCQRSAD
jgi:hypothetical protein